MKRCNKGFTIYLSLQLCLLIDVIKRLLINICSSRSSWAAFTPKRFWDYTLEYNLVLGVATPMKLGFYATTPVDSSW